MGNYWLKEGKNVYFKFRGEIQKAKINRVSVHEGTMREWCVYELRWHDERGRLRGIDMEHECVHTKKGDVK